MSRGLLIRAANIIVGMFIFYFFINFDISGLEVIIGGFLAGFASCYGEKRTLYILIYSLGVILLVYVGLFAYFSLYNPYGFMKIWDTGLIIAIPLIYSTASSIAGGISSNLISLRIQGR